MKVLWNRLGHPDAINGFSFLFVLILQTSGSILSSLIDFEERVFEFLGLRLLSLLVLGCVLGVGRLALNRWARSTPRPLLTLAVFSLAIAAGAAVFDVSLVATGFAEEYRFVSRLITAFIGVMTGLVLVALLVTSAREQSRSLAELAQAADQLRSLRADAEERISTRREELIHTIRDTIDDQLNLIGFGSASDTAVVRNLIDDVVRPLSYSLARGDSTVVETTSAQPTSRVDWRSVIVDSFRGQPFHPVALAIVLGVISAPFLLLNFRAEGSLTLALLMVTVAAFTASAALLWQILPNGLSLPFRIIIFTAVSLPKAVLSAWMIQEITGVPFLDPLRFGAWMTIVTISSWAVALVFTVFTKLEETTAELVTTVDELKREVTSLNTSLRQLHKSISRILHGPIQEAITSVLVRLESRPSLATQSTFATDLRTRIESALTLVRSPSAVQGDPVAVVENLQELWGDDLNITLAAGASDLETLRAHPQTSYAVAEVIREGCQNAIRHGEARSIVVTISVHSDQQTVEIVVENSGIAMTEVSHAGLGSQMLDELTLEWQRVNLAEGARLRATLPILGH